MRKSTLVFSRRLLVLAAILSGLLLLTGQQQISNKVSPKVVKSLLERKLKLEFVPGEIIVKKKVVAGIAAEIAPAQITELGLQPKGERTAGGEQVYKLTTQLLTTMSEKDVKARTLSAAAALRARPEVEYAQPNYILHIVNTSPNDTQFSRQWHYMNRGTGPGNSPGGIGLPTVWDSTEGSSSVVVAVVDTGILPNHEDIAGSPNLVQGVDMVSDPAMANDGDGRDNNPTDPGDAVAAGECEPGKPALPSSWHGTHVAGTIGAGRTNNGLGVAGVNWNVKVQAVRVLGKCGGTIVDINDGIRWAAGLHVPGMADNTTPAKVINMSLGGPSPCSSSPATQSAINDAVAAGATVVVAAGNDAEDASGFFPASCDKVISVAASDARGFLVQRYSNFGSIVKIMAPGGDIQRDDDGDGQPDGVLSMVDGGYAYYNGTSMAAPHVSGVVALMLAKTPGLTPTDILARLTSSAIPRTASECPKPCGAGLLNAPGAVSFSDSPMLALEPIDTQLKPSGTGQLTFTLRQGGVAQAGKTVTFVSDDPGVADVTPASAVTDSSGQATVTASAKKEGATTVRAQAAGKEAQAQVRVKAPALSDWGLVLAGLILLLVFHRYAGKFREGAFRRR